MDLAMLDTIYHNPETSSDSPTTSNNAVEEQKKDRQTILKRSLLKENRKARKGIRIRMGWGGERDRERDYLIWKK